ncbi:hypothetical protein BGX26_010539 [Mortierella sp. AD094]|nr:hypothetical protein BGX26_010539 [Mortierella sp. AD094]
MAAASEQMAMHQQQDLKGPVASTASINGGTISAAQKSSNSIHSSARSIKSERRPSFSITLPPSCSRSSLLSNKSVYAMEDADSSTSSSVSFGNRAIIPAARRPSVHFTSDDDDCLMNHEGKHGLPKTPYPTTEEEDERIQNSLFKN